MNAHAISALGTSSSASRSPRLGRLLRNGAAMLLTVMGTLVAGGCDNSPVQSTPNRVDQGQTLATVQMKFGPDGTAGGATSGILFAQVVNAFLTPTGATCFGHLAQQPCPTGLDGLHTVTVTLKNTSSNTLEITGIDATYFSNCQFVSFNNGLPVLSPNEEFTVSITVNVHDETKSFGVAISVLGNVL